MFCRNRVQKQQSSSSLAVTSLIWCLCIVVCNDNLVPFAERPSARFDHVKAVAAIFAFSGKLVETLAASTQSPTMSLTSTCTGAARFDGSLPSRLIPHRHRPRAEFQP